jgi:hypothetical protein
MTGKQRKTQRNTDADEDRARPSFDPEADPALQYAMFLRPLLDELGIGIPEQALADTIRPICGEVFDHKALAIIAAVTGRLLDDRRASLRRRAQAEDRMARRAARDRAVELALLRMVALLQRIDASLSK